MDDGLRGWLTDGDPAVRWRVTENRTEAAQQRARIATEGWGARLLAAQDAGGTWAGGLYTPKWTSTPGPSRLNSCRAMEVLAWWESPVR